MSTSVKLILAVGGRETRGSFSVNVFLSTLCRFCAGLMGSALHGTFAWWLVSIDFCVAFSVTPAGSDADSMRIPRGSALDGALGAQ